MNNVSNINSKRIGGLASGLNTDEIVESMLARSQAKIDKQYQSKQLLTWQQEALRTIIRSANAFQNKWFNYANPATNLGSNTFWQTTQAATNSKYFTVKANSAANKGNVTVDYVKQLAESQTISSEKLGNTYIQTSNPMADMSDVDKENYMKSIRSEIERMDSMGKKPSITIDVDGIKKTIEFDFSEDDLKDHDSYIAAFNKQMKDGINKYFSSKVYVSDADNGGIRIETKNTSSKLTLTGTMLHDVGVASGVTNKPDIYDSLKNVKHQFGNDRDGYITGGVYEFSINGTNFKFTEKDSLSSIMSKINSSDCGVKMTFSEYTNTFKLTATQEGAGNNIDIKQTSGNLLSALFGVEASDKITSKAFSDGLQADNGFNLEAIKNNISAPFTITIKDENGRDVTRTIELPARNSKGDKIDYSKYEADQIKSLLDTEINKAFGTNKFTVKIDRVKTGEDDEGNALYADKFSITHRDGGEIKIGGYTYKDKDGNMVTDNRMLNNLGFAGEKSNAVSRDTKLADLGIEAGESLNINGQTFTVSDNMTLNDLMSAVNNSGTGATMEMEDGRLAISGIKEFSGSDKIQELFGVSGTYKPLSAADVDFTDNLRDKYQLFGDKVINVNGADITVKIDENTTFKGLVDQINTAVPGAVELDQFGYIKFNVAVKDAGGAGNDLMKTLFNGEAVAGAVGAVGSRNSEGKDAIFSINGEEIVRSSNTIDYDGVEITFNETFDTAQKITVTSDIDATVDKIKEFMEDYNKLIDEIKTKVGEKSYSKDYPPLTDAQKKEMSKEEIEKWEEKAKSGILKNDQNLNRYLQELRSVMYEASPNGLGIYDLGIVTGDYKDGGKLKFADNLANGKTGEDVLREMLTNNPDKVREMFTNAENGLVARLKKVNEDAMSASITNRGYIANVAGLEGTFSDGDNIISGKIDSIDKMIEKYKDAMKAEEDRYWRQFTALEKMISQMNAQSSWLFDQMM